MLCRQPQEQRKAACVSLVHSDDCLHIVRHKISDATRPFVRYLVDVCLFQSFSRHGKTLRKRGCTHICFRCIPHTAHLHMRTRISTSSRAVLPGPWRARWPAEAGSMQLRAVSGQVGVTRAQLAAGEMKCIDRGLHLAPFRNRAGKKQEVWELTERNKGLAHCSLRDEGRLGTSCVPAGSANKYRCGQLICHLT